MNFNTKQIEQTNAPIITIDTLLGDEKMIIHFEDLKMETSLALHPTRSVVFVGCKTESGYWFFGNIFGSVFFESNLQDNTFEIDLALHFTNANDEYILINQTKANDVDVILFIWNQGQFEIQYIPQIDDELHKFYNSLVADKNAMDLALPLKLIEKAFPTAKLSSR
ncbi:MAG TPA: hypothetical protein IAA29_16255 [Candidatus Paenibacillus intestinavium]|nr:hypothetical protein [Candidatus Paenibacillus intestinavium]